ncbi:hypothetical protein [Wolbachia endosymbiont of Pentidionis agamae]|uniref:hypothetical protein n=1 Tax=Wolbachia endosymbiont of Pentidionis agamae TaxID=3110435 RepID=UPI002FD38935
MSTSLIIFFAFIVGFLSSYKLLRGAVIKTLAKRRLGIQSLMQDSLSLEKDLCVYLAYLLQKTKDLECEKSKLIKGAQDKGNIIINNGKQEMESELAGSLCSSMEKISEQALDDLDQFKLSAAEVASRVAEELIKKHSFNEECKGGDISFLSHNLSKKFN